MIKKFTSDNEFLMFPVLSITDDILYKTQSIFCDVTPRLIDYIHQYDQTIELKEINQLFISEKIVYFTKFSLKVLSVLQDELQIILKDPQIYLDNSLDKKIELIYKKLSEKLSNSLISEVKDYYQILVHDLADLYYVFYNKYDILKDLVENEYMLKYSDKKCDYVFEKFKLNDDIMRLLSKNLKDFKY
jgi:hypothetical protein